jgi:hypothetical protein
MKLCWGAEGAGKSPNSLEKQKMLKFGDLPAPSAPSWSKVLFSYPDTNTGKCIIKL